MCRREGVGLSIIQVDADPLPGVMHSVMIQYEEDSFS